MSGGSERFDWIALSLCEGMGGASFARLLSVFGSAGAALHASREQLLTVGGIRTAAIDSITGRRWERLAEEELEKARRCGAQLLTPADEAYPGPLRSMEARPPVIYAKGSLVIDWQVAVTVVGTRRPTPSGREAAKRLAGELAGKGAAVVSGGAIGVDTAAHEAALLEGGKTVCVLGTGIDVAYPRGNTRLFDQICDCGGCLLTSFRMSTLPRRENFPARNRFLAGLGRCVVVVQAGSRSGAMITASFAAKMGRPLFVVPGVLSPGGEALVRAASASEASAMDILRFLGLAAPNGNASKSQPDLSAAEAQLLALMETGPLQGDEFTARCGMKPAELATVLLGLELKGAVRRLGGNRFARV